MQLFAQIPSTYKGTPYQNKPQEIPGIIEGELWDEGGEGISFHDRDVGNRGLGWYRPGGPDTKQITTYDRRYVKLGDTAKITEPDTGHLYLAYAQDSEWTCYTIKITQAGVYTISSHMAVTKTGVAYSFFLDDKPLLTKLQITPTKDPHVWWIYKDFAEVTLPEGLHVLRILGHYSNLDWIGNIDYLDFRLKSSTSTYKTISERAFAITKQTQPSINIVNTKTITHNSLIDLTGRRSNPTLHMFGVKMILPKKIGEK